MIKLIISINFIPKINSIKADILKKGPKGIMLSFFLITKYMAIGKAIATITNACKNPLNTT